MRKDTWPRTSVSWICMRRTPQHLQAVLQTLVWSLRPASGASVFEVSIAQPEPRREGESLPRHARQLRRMS